MRRLTVPEAAEALGITTDAVRMRLSRRTLDSVREDGRVYVLLDDDATGITHGRSGESDALISQMQAEIEYLREESRRKDHIIAGLVERIPPAIEASSEKPSESPQTATEDPAGTETPQEPQSATERRWWEFWR